MKYQDFEKQGILYTHKRSNVGVKIPNTRSQLDHPVYQFTYEAPRAHILPVNVINSLCLMCSVIIVFYFAFQNL